MFGRALFLIVGAASPFAEIARCRTRAEQRDFECETATEPIRTGLARMRQAHKGRDTLPSPSRLGEAGAASLRRSRVWGGAGGGVFAPGSMVDAPHQSPLPARGRGLPRRRRAGVRRHWSRWCELRGARPLQLMMRRKAAILADYENEIRTHPFPAEPIRIKSSVVFIVPSIQTRAPFEPAAEAMRISHQSSFGRHASQRCPRRQQFVSDRQ